MAKFSLASLFESLIGKLNRKDEITYRSTRRYDRNGKVVLDSKHAYMVMNKRDFSKKPPKGAEKRNMDIIRKAQHLTQLAISPDSKLLPMWEERFDKQLHTGKPDPEIPVNPKTHQRKIYTQFDRFVYAVIYYRLQQDTPPA